MDVAGSELAGAAKGIRCTRLRGRGEPPGTGMEPDCAFYVGERAREFRDVLVTGRKEAADFIERIAPDLVVEVEITSADAGKVERYAEMGVRELWRLHGRKGSDELRADFLALRPDREPRVLDTSGLLEGLSPEDVCAAVEGVRHSLTATERTEAIARIVRRRRRESVRVREEDAPPYAVDSKAPRQREARASS